MSIGWPAAIVLATLIIGVVALIGTRIAARAALDGEEIKGKYMEQYQVLAEDYAKLARETRASQATVQADVARLADSVDSIETMMREVS